MLFLSRVGSIRAMALVWLALLSANVVVCEHLLPEIVFIHKEVINAHIFWLFG
jgi:hypothetical protein